MAPHIHRRLSLTGFRAGSSAGNASRSFSVTCQSNCSYSAGLECLGVSCGILKLQKPDASLYASVRLARYTNDYPYSLNPAEALHPQAVSATCQEGFRGEGGTTNATCFSTFQVDCWDGAYVPQTMARCVPSVCPIFNSAHAGNASALNLSGAPPRMHDDNALSWNLTSEAGYGVAINVTCKPGHRAVSTDFNGTVMCVEPSWYVTTCGTCDWELTVSCQPVWCAAPAGSHIKSTTPVAFTRFAEACDLCGVKVVYSQSIKHLWDDHGEKTCMVGACASNPETSDARQSSDISETFRGRASASVTLT